MKSARVGPVDAGMVFFVNGLRDGPRDTLDPRIARRTR